jgi:AraC family transcriptional regulator, regulatory protein of adaptative response / methylated-DNA-[protein]-cysteine methyltransferase
MDDFDFPPRFRTGDAPLRGAAQRDPYVAAVVKACILIGEAEETPNLDQLAKAAGFSRFHFHRVFKSVTGLTPHEYVVARRAQRLRHVISQATTVSEAMYQAGFTSHGTFYSLAQSMLGMTPTRFRTGGSGVRITFALSASSLGTVLIATSEKGICSVLTGDDEGRLVGQLRRSFPRAQLVPGGHAFDELVTSAVSRSELPHRARQLPLDVRITALTGRLHQALCVPLATRPLNRDVRA